MWVLDPCRRDQNVAHCIDPNWPGKVAWPGYRHGLTSIDDDKKKKKSWLFFVWLLEITALQ